MSSASKVGLNPIVDKVTEIIKTRSASSRALYLDRMNQAAKKGVSRRGLSCGNLAHGIAGCGTTDKKLIRELSDNKINNVNVLSVNVGLVTAYNDMLSAHKPFEHYPDIIRKALNDVGASGQVAGAVPAMCDGVTQGQPGMELSLFSRDQVAMSTGIALSHNMFDAVLCLGVCDKIVPGLLIGVLRFGHLPVIFIPAGPMNSGLANDDKAKVRQDFAKGVANREELLDAELKSYHSPGTCTFYGTANTNQMLMEFMGLHLPGTSFVNPGTPLREALTIESAQRVTKLAQFSERYTPVSQVIDEKAIVNGIVGLLATGGSTNLTIHMIAIARAAGIIINWQDFSDLSEAVPLTTKVYPNGGADINHFHAAGGLGFVIRDLLKHGLLHGDTLTVAGVGLGHYTEEPVLDKSGLRWKEGALKSLDETILRSAEKPFQSKGGIKLLKGNLGRSVIKVAAVKPEHLLVEAPAVIFSNQTEMEKAFNDDKLNRDCVVVIRYQGPKSNGMPELHRLTPALSVLLERGHKVALITDGRMSGASGKVPAAIHVSPEASDQGPIAKLRDGDIVRLDVNAGELNVLIPDDEWNSRKILVEDLRENEFGVGRELFTMMRANVSDAQTGATIFKFEDELELENKDKDKDKQKGDSS